MRHYVRLGLIEPWEAYQAEAEGARRLEAKSLRQHIAEMLVWLACRIDPRSGIWVRPGFPA
ncbi:MAG TPA: hypothetical protein VFS50_00820 [Meiothermus sp.]|nr:hypothetical protein [Meiothermus sp.]